jgi:hypothetical protein
MGNCLYDTNNWHWLHGMDTYYRSPTPKVIPVDWRWANANDVLTRPQKSKIASLEKVVVNMTQLHVCTMLLWWHGLGPATLARMQGCNTAVSLIPRCIDLTGVYCIVRPCHAHNRYLVASFCYCTAYTQLYQIHHANWFSMQCQKTCSTVALYTL